MRTEFLPHTKNYLIESLDKQMTEDVNVEFIKNVKLCEGGGGSGVGIPAFDYNKAKNDASKSAMTMDGSVLFGNSNINMAGALGLYAGGKALNSLADLVGAGKLGGKALSKAAGALSNIPILGPAAQIAAQLPGQLGGGLLKNIADLSGAKWFDANMQNISQSEMGLAAQGSGKPFVPLQVPKLKGEDDENPFDTDVQRRKAVASAKAEEEAKKYRGMGYKIP